MFTAMYVLEVGHWSWSPLLLGVLHYRKHRSKPTQKSEIITTSRLRGTKIPELNQCRRVSNKIVTANGIRQQWDYAKCDSVATCAKTSHFGALT